MGPAMRAGHRTHPIPKSELQRYGYKPPPHAKGTIDRGSGVLMDTEPAAVWFIFRSMFRPNFFRAATVWKLCWESAFLYSRHVDVALLSEGCVPSAFLQVDGDALERIGRSCAWVVAMAWVRVRGRWIVVDGLRHGEDLRTRAAIVVADRCC
jgi:hypothetical protein